MNLFVLDESPVVSAQQQCDKHVVKMIVESAQMLSTAHRYLDGQLTSIPSKSGKTNVKYWKLDDYREPYLYKPVHVNHPCTIWTRESVANYMWHYRHFLALCYEYRYRYGRMHKTEEVLSDVLSFLPYNIPAGKLTPFRLAMGSNPECIDNNDVVGSYRKYYKSKQSQFNMRWTKRQTPSWFSEVIGNA
jgi:hypothetical protein